jgi:hypothetical protein
MSVKIKCLGYCWVKKAGVIVWRCDQTQCPIWYYYFAEFGPKVETCFT